MLQDKQAVFQIEEMLTKIYFGNFFFMTMKWEFLFECYPEVGTIWVLKRELTEKLIEIRLLMWLKLILILTFIISFICKTFLVSFGEDKMLTR